MEARNTMGVPENELKKVSAGKRGKVESEEGYDPYTNNNFPVRCPACGGNHLEYSPSKLFREIDAFHCLTCDHYFRRYETPEGGASSGW